MLLNKNRKFTLLLIIFTVLLMLSGCGSNNSSRNEIAMDKGSSDSVQPQVNEDIGFDNVAEYEGVDRGTDSIEQNSNPIDTGRKIIKSGRIEMETKEFDKATNAIIAKVNAIGGYTETSNINGRRINDKSSSSNRIATFKLRVPENEFENFMMEFNNIGNVILQEKTGTDITSQYFDSEARLKSLQIQEERLLDILKKADKIEDIIELERELSDVRYQIENLTGTLRKWDNMVNFATIQVTVYEVQDLTEEEPESLGAKIAYGFNNSVKGVIRLVKEIIIGIAVIIPYLVVFTLIILLVRYIYVKVKPKILNKKDK